MENFNVYDMKVGDKAIFKCGRIIPDTYTAERVSSNVMCLEHHGEERFRYSYDIHTVEHYLKKGDWVITEYLAISDKQQNTFTKSDLISGEHVVELCNGKRYLVAGDYLFSDMGYMMLSDYNDLLEAEDDGYYTINKVFCGKDFNGRLSAGSGLGKYLVAEDLKIVYDRQENEHRASQKARLCALEESIAEQQKEAEQLREELKL